MNQIEHYQTSVEHYSNNYAQGNFESGISHAEAKDIRARWTQ